MNKYILTLLFSISLNAFSGTSSKEEQNSTASLCVPSMEKFQACKQAARMVNEIQPMLPMQSDELTVIESIFSDKNIFSFQARLTGNKEQIRTYFKKLDLKFEDIEAKMKEWTTELLCKNQEYFNFIKSGGHIRFVTKYKDGTHQQTINIKSCNNKLLDVN